MVTRLFPVVALLAGLPAAGCMGLGLPEPPIVTREVDPTSPAAQAVLRAEQAAFSAEYPKWSDVEPYPTDVRPPAEWNAAAREVIADHTALARWRAANPAELTDTEAFAQSQRDKIGLDPATLPPAPTPEQSAAYAAEQRRRAGSPQ